MFLLSHFLFNQTHFGIPKAFDFTQVQHLIEFFNRDKLPNFSIRLVFTYISLCCPPNIFSNVWANKESFHCVCQHTP